MRLHIRRSADYPSHDGLRYIFIAQRFNGGHSSVVSKKTHHHSFFQGLAQSRVGESQVISDVASWCLHHTAKSETVNVCFLRFQVLNNKLIEVRATLLKKKPNNWRKTLVERGKAWLCLISNLSSLNKGNDDRNGIWISHPLISIDFCDFNTVFENISKQLKMRSFVFDILWEFQILHEAALQTVQTNTFGWNNKEDVLDNLPN